MFILSIYFVSADNLLNINLGEESGFIPSFKDINIKFSSVTPSVCKMAPCPQIIEVSITKKNVLDKKANIFTLSEGESIEIYGVNIKLVSVQDDSASFLLSDGKEEIIPVEEETIITPIESQNNETLNIKIKVVGEKKIISVSGATGRDCTEYLKECNSGNQVLCEKWDTNCKEKNITVGTKEEIKVKNNKLYMNDKEVKIMPDTASEKAIETLQINKNITIELKDTGKPVYDVEGKKEVKVFGLFKKEMLLKTEIDGETGEVTSVKRPWWSFLAKE